MTRLRPLITLAKMPLAQQGLAVQAGITLIRAQAMCRLRPMRRWSSRLGQPQANTFVVPPGASLPKAAGIARMVETVAMRLPTRPGCLPQAIAVKWMLDARGIDAALFIGARSPQDGDIPLDAHAWIGIGNRILIGGAKSKDYHILSVFS